MYEGEKERRKRLRQRHYHLDWYHETGRNRHSKDGTDYTNKLAVSKVRCSNCYPQMMDEDHQSILASSSPYAHLVMF